MTERDKVIQALENLAAEPMFGGQQDRLKQAIDLLRSRTYLRAKVERWEKVFWAGHPDRSIFMELTEQERREMYEFLKELLQCL